MAQTIDFMNVENASFNGQALTKIVLNGERLWERVLVSRTTEYPSTRNTTFSYTTNYSLNTTVSRSTSFVRSTQYSRRTGRWTEVSGDMGAEYTYYNTYYNVNTTASRTTSFSQSTAYSRTTTASRSTAITLTRTTEYISIYRRT